MSKSNQRHGERDESQPSLADETDSLAAGIGSLEMDANGSDTSVESVESVSRRPRKKKNPEVIDLCSEDGEDEDGEEDHNAESDQN